MALRKVLVPIANGTEPMEVVVTIDVLGRAGADVTVASVVKQLTVEACHEVKVVADAMITDCVDTVFDLISLPGGMLGATNLRDSDPLVKLARKQKKGRPSVCCNRCICGYCTRGWGLRVDSKATCFPSLMKKLSSYRAIVVESRVHLNENAITSQGPGTAMEYSFTPVEQLYGNEKAAKVSGPLLIGSTHDDQFIVTELNKVQWTCSSKPKILVPIANGLEEMEAVMIIDVLRRAKAEVVVASVGNKLEIVASHRVKLVADMLLDEAAKLSYDLIVLPGGFGGARAFANSKTLVNLLKKQNESGKYYRAMCASPTLVLEPHGLLKGKKATAFPPMCDKPSDRSAVENRVVVDGNLITSRGPGTSLEFSLAIVEKLLGREKALEIAKVMLVV